MVDQPYKFFINPSPTDLNDLLMSRRRIESWIDGPIKCTPEIFSMEGSFIFSRDAINQLQFNQNNFFVPYLCSTQGYLESVVAG